MVLIRSERSVAKSVSKVKQSSILGLGIARRIWVLLAEALQRFYARERSDLFFYANILHLNNKIESLASLA